jgi:hypothetical protein
MTLNAPAPAAMVQSEYFCSQMEELDEAQREQIWRWLNRARDGKPTPGVLNPWGPDSDYLLWPCGDFMVVLRRMGPDEVAGVGGQTDTDDDAVEGVEGGGSDAGGDPAEGIGSGPAPRRGFCLIRIEMASRWSSN